MKLTVGIVDYGVGNHASVKHTLRRIDLRCRTSDDPTTLDSCDLLILPGVGAFRPAMCALRERGLDEYLVRHAAAARPLLGICLGMQLLVQASHEGGFTTRLGLIPGEIVPLPDPHWHIGWNTIEQVQVDPLLQPSDRRAFFFNHSYAYRGPIEHQICRATAGEAFGAVIRRGNVLGLQFHPEKSQAAGRLLLKNVISGLCNA